MEATIYATSKSGVYQSRRGKPGFEATITIYGKAVGFGIDSRGEYSRTSVIRI